jgi:hypothetical protein
MGRKPATLKIRLPAALAERAKADAATCGLTVREFVSQTAHGALAARLCQHRGVVPATPTEPARGADAADDSED